jgi:hypothetical protein
LGDEGYTKNSFYGDEGAWTKSGHIVAKHDRFRTSDLLGIPNDKVLPSTEEVV